MVVLVTANGLSRGAVDMGKPVQVRVDQDPMDRRRGDPEPAGELDRSFAQAQAELDERLVVAWLVLFGDRWGREERSCMDWPVR